MSRLLKIAVREYLAYVRTVGFWLSLCLTPVGLAIGFAGPALIMRSEPPPRIAVLDLTGQGYAAEIAGALSAPHAPRPNAGPGPSAVMVASPVAAPKDPADAGRRLRPYLARPAGGQRAPLDAAAVIHAGPDGGVVVDFWSRNLTERGAEATA